tara:strand:+ start:1331 stop:2407 length:1077 start_codon:yes stop_codon:yes gene_type:complete
LKNIIIISQSYRQLKNALYIIENEKNKNNITIIVLNHYNLYRAYCDISEKVYNNDIKIEFIKRYQSKSNSLRNKLLVPKLIDIVKEKKYLANQFNAYFKNIRNYSIYFSSRHFSDYGFYIINRLAKNNKIIYIPSPDADLLPTKRKFSFTPKRLTNLMINKFIFGARVSETEYISHVFPFMDDSFMKKNVDEMVQIPERENMINGLDMNKFAIWNKEQFNVLYFGHNALNIRSSKDEFEKLLNEVFNILCKYFKKNKIASKYHPGRENDTIIKKGIILDDYIPSEFLYSNSTKLYISIYSSSLASIVNGVVISLIDLIPTKNPKHKKEVKKRLIEMSKVQIKFPRTLSEFESIVKDIP